MIATVLGGVGLFLLGMVLMTDGLKAAAGDALSGILSRFTGGPLSAVASGAAVTALVQSSSATTLATIGFVSAGLLTFPQSIGILLGAAVGTTSTGWIVSLLGLKLQIGAIALPLVGIGALMRLLTRDRAASIGLAIAGFGLIFVGIATLQGGMQEVAERIDPASLPGATVLGRIALVGIGIGLTLIMQSSSASVAMTLTALHSGTVVLEQAAFLVIGHNVGTTLTAAFAAIGASSSARRTATAHILFSMTSGSLALIGLPLYLATAGWLATALGSGGEATTIAAFHTTFNIVGVAVVLPFIDRFANIVERLVPDRGPVLTRNLDISVTQVAPVAIEAARRTTIEIAAELAAEVADRLSKTAIAPQSTMRLAAVNHALTETRRFLAAVRSAPDAPSEHSRHLSVLHAMDHLDRLTSALEGRSPIAELEAASQARSMLDESREAVARLREWYADPSQPAPVELIRALSSTIADERRSNRGRVLEETALGGIEPEAALEYLDAVRWLDRVIYHVWRATHHLASEGVAGTVTEPEVFEDASDAESFAPAGGEA